MNSLLIYLLEVSICLGISLVIYRVLLSGLTFFSWNRSILLSLLILSGMIPLLELDFFGLAPEVTEITLPVFLVGDQVNIGEKSTFSWIQVAVWVYLIGAAFTASRMIFGFIISQSQIGKAQKIYHNNHFIAIHPDFVPASFFEYILMPEFNPDCPEQKQILLHESMHVRLLHSWDLLLVNFAKVLFWFNPLIYSFERSLREIHEYQADQGVTYSYAPREYATLLLQLITAKPGWQFMNNFNQFQTKKRIIMMGKSKSSPMQRLRFLSLIPVVGVLLFVFSCEKEEMEPNFSQLEEFPETLVIPFENPVNTFQNADEVFDVVEIQPDPEGGMAGWNKYLATNLQYPVLAREKGIEGTVIVVFEIHTDGSIHNVEILRGIGGGADEEAVRVVQNAPKWIPGKQRGREVITRMRLPIRFKLASLANSKSTISVNRLKEKPYEPSGHLQELAVIGYVPSID